MSEPLQGTPLGTARPHPRQQGDDFVAVQNRLSATIRIGGIAVLTLLSTSELVRTHFFAPVMYRKSVHCQPRPKKQSAVIRVSPMKVENADSSSAVVQY